MRQDIKEVYFVGGGLASLSGAAYLIRDCGIEGKHIHVLEGLKRVGGSNDGMGDAASGYVCRGGRMLNEETFENFWDIFSSIPSLDDKTKTVKEEILEFDHAHPTHSNARLINKYGEVLDVLSMQFDQNDRTKLMKLLMAPEGTLDNVRINQYFDPHFFETNFWYMWQTTFAFQKWSSLFELKRYLQRMIFEFSRIHTLEGVTRTPYNQFDAVILPLKTYLEQAGVDFQTDVVATDVEFEDSDDIVVSSITIMKDNQEDKISLTKDDLCFVTIGCMTDCSTKGDLNTPAPEYKTEPMSYNLWQKMADKKPGRLGNPAPFFNNPEETKWQSFTVTLRGNKLLKMIEKFSRNVPGSGALMTFKDSKSLMSIVVSYQPYFRNQPETVTTFWGYVLYPNNDGDYVKKPIKDCSGKEILYELIHQLHFEEHLDDIMEDVVNVIPVMMPYITSQFQPRAMADRPAVVPEGSVNLALLGQYVELQDDMVFTEEYSVRAARTAVYQLMDSNKTVCPVTPHHYDIRVLLKALNTSFR